MEKRFFIHRLDRASDVAVSILERIGRLAAWPKKIFQRRREQIAELRRVIVPLVRDLRSVMAEIIKVQPEGPIRQKTNQFAKLVEVGRFAVWSKSHHLVFIAVVREPEILRQRLVEHPKRVRKIDPLRDRKIGPASETPGRAGKISKTVDRHSDGLLEWRHVEGRG